MWVTGIITQNAERHIYLGNICKGSLKEGRKSNQWQRERRTFIVMRRKGRHEELDLVINNDLQQNYEK